MARLIDPQFRLAQQQQRLQERRLQLENDPGRIFLRSLAQSVPQELIRGGVQIGRDALGYKFFGGERELARREAEAFGAARPGFFKKYQPEAYARYQDQQQQRARQIKGQQAARRKQQERQAEPRQPVMPQFQDAGDGKFIMKVPSGQNYLVSKEEKDRMEAGFKRGKEGGFKAKDQKQQQQQQQPSAPSYDFSNLQREQQRTMSTTTGASLQLPERPDFFASSQEQIKYNERLQKSREAVFKRQSEEAVKRRDRLQKATEDQLKRLYDFLPQVSAEELARQAALLDQMIATEPNAEVRELLSIAKSQLPSEEFRANAAQYIGKSGNRRWSKISKSIPTRISFQAQRTSVLEAVKRRTAEIERLEQLSQTPETTQEIETLKLANRIDVSKKGLAEAVPLKDGKLMATSAEMKARAGKGTPGLSAVEFANANKASIETELKENPQAKKKFDSQMIASTKQYKKDNPSATDEEASRFGFTMAYQATFNPNTSVLRRSDKKGTSGGPSEKFNDWRVNFDDLLIKMEKAPLSNAEVEWAERNFESVGSDRMKSAITNMTDASPHTNASGKGTAKRLEDAVNALE